MADFQGRSCKYSGCSDEFISLIKQVDAWDIVPLRYAAPSNIEMTIGRKEVSFYDSNILSDPELSDLEFRLMIRLCSFYPSNFMDLCTFEGVNGYVIKGLDDEWGVRDMLLSLRDRGYISLDPIEPE